MKNQTICLDRKLPEKEIHANKDKNSIRSFSYRQQGVVLVLNIQADCRELDYSSQVYSDNLI